MRIFSFISALAALVTTVVSVSVPDPCTNSEMKCDINVAPKRDFIEHPSRNVRAMTNAELLRRGLPLNRPVLRRGTFEWLQHIVSPLLRLSNHSRYSCPPHRAFLCA